MWLCISCPLIISRKSCNLNGERLSYRVWRLHDHTRFTWLISFSYMLSDEIKRFLGENKSENTIFIFTVCEKKNWFFYELSAKSLVQKVWNVVQLSKITARTLTFRDRTADVTYYDDVTIFLNARTIIDCSIFLGRFLTYYCFKSYLGSWSLLIFLLWVNFLGTKAVRILGKINYVLRWRPY